MGLPNETSWECDECGVFNIEHAIIRNGKMYCNNCWINKCLPPEQDAPNSPIIPSSELGQETNICSEGTDEQQIKKEIDKDYE